MLALKVAVSVALLTWLFSKVDMAVLWEQAQHASVAWMAVALAIYAVNIAAGTWRWRLLLEAQGVHIPPLRLFGSFLVAAVLQQFSAEQHRRRRHPHRRHGRACPLKNAGDDGRLHGSGARADGPRARCGCRRDDGVRTSGRHPAAAHRPVLAVGRLSSGSGGRRTGGDRSGHVRQAAPAADPPPR